MSGERETALVTGASGGIGEETVKLLAERGCDLVLVSRNGEKLRRLAEAISPARADVLALDLASASAPAEVASFLASKSLEVDILVNNAGYATFGPFSETNLADELGEIQLNVATLTHLTKLVLPGMIRRGRGRILNVASTAAFQPGPLMAVYYASKAYVLSLSEALANECEGTGVRVSALCPGPTETGFVAAAAGMSESKLFDRAVMDARTVAEAGYRGMFDGKAIVIPGFRNNLLARSIGFFPRNLVTKVVRGIQEKRSH